MVHTRVRKFISESIGLHKLDVLFLSSGFLAALISSILTATCAFAEPTKIIYETDFTFDVDDVGALALLHALANEGEAELLGVSYNEVHSDAVRAIDAINTWYGRGDLPIGTYDKELAAPDDSGYLATVAKKSQVDATPTSSSLEMYKAILAEQPDNSVVIASVGFTNNLFDLLKDDDARKLAAQKVKLLVLMGGDRNDGFNFFRHETADEADYVIRNWPGRVVISYEGGRMCTGNGLLKTPKQNPVHQAYVAATPWLAKEHGVGNRCKNKGDEINQPSWDQVAALFAVRHQSNPGGMFVLKSDGKMNTRKHDPMPYQKGKLEYVVSKDKAATKKEIERLMTRPPRPSTADVKATLKRAAEFYYHQVAKHGGYHDQYAADLSFGRSSKRTEGPDMISVTGSGTPSVGQAFLMAWQCTGDKFYLNAARDAGLALARGQLCSGGWDYGIQFNPKLRKPLRYRVDVGCTTPRDEPSPAKTNLDNNATQGAMRFLMRLDRELEFSDGQIHTAARFALDGLIKGQYPNGAWPQRFNAFPDPAKYPVKRASAPDSWSLEWPGPIFHSHYTINDEATLNMIDVLLEAHRIYGDEDYLVSAKRGGDFLILAQMPAPQPAWAQQYDVNMHPAWGRKFEPPGICGRESQDVIRTLLLLYCETGLDKYLRPIPAALDYLEASIQKDDGTSHGRDYLCRFYETKTNRPIFVTRGTRLYVDDDPWRLLDGYDVTFDPADDLVSHYSLKLGTEQLSELRRQYEFVRQAKLAELRRPDILSSLTPWRSSCIPSESLVDVERVAKIMAAQSDRGAWSQPGSFARSSRVVGFTTGEPMTIVIGDKTISLDKEQTVSLYRGDERPNPEIIHSGTFAANVRALCELLK